MGKVELVLKSNGENSCNKFNSSAVNQSITNADAEYSR